MKAKAPLFSLYFISFIGFSQNWQTIKSIDTNYFKSNEIGSNYMITTQIDSFHYINSDSIFYPFKTLRNLTQPTVINGVIAVAYPGNSWLGPKIVIKSNGDNLYFNENADTILIKTLANLNDSYTLFRYSDGSTIEATITGVSQETIFGITDSVKTFTLTSANPSFNLNNKSFKISKQNGFIQLIPFNYFPYLYSDYQILPVSKLESEYQLVGKENPRTGITKPTFNDVNNLEIGDIIQYVSSGGPSHNYYEKEILTKTLFSIDSVSYTIKQSYFNHFDGVSADNPANTSQVTIDTIIEKYKISNEYISSKIPEKMYFEHLLTNSYVDEFITLSHSNDCGFHLVKHFSGYYPIYNNQNDSIYYDNWQTSYKTYTSISSAFSYYNSCLNNQIPGCDYSTSLISKNTSNYDCGNPFYLNIEEESLQTQLNFYPNPATNKITLKGNYKSIIIYNNLGQIIYSETEPSTIIDISSLPKGLFFVKGVDKNDLTYSSKLIIE